MLKINYIESGLYLEWTACSVESFISNRAILAVRSGSTIHIEPGSASFLLPVQTPDLALLDEAIRCDRSKTISMGIVDAQYVEVSLKGIWVASAPDAEEGIFASALSDRVEFYLHQVWQLTQPQIGVGT
jgi:hypothetical protein